MASPSKKLKLSKDSKAAAASSPPTESAATIIKFNKKRLQVLKKNKDYLKNRCKGVVYWMSRDKRVQDNWALIYAQKLAIKHDLPLHVVFCLSRNLPHPTMRRCHFLVKGLEEVEQECRSLNISFHLLIGEADTLVMDFMKKHDSACLVTDMTPLRHFREQVKSIEKSLAPDSCFYQVDAHNIIPVWEASDKQEYAARTIRPKITEKMGKFLTEFPLVTKHPIEFKEGVEKVDWNTAYEALTIDKSVGIATDFTPGTAEGLQAIERFIEKSLKNFSSLRNNPNIENAASNLSPYMNFGQLSAQRVVLRVKKSGKTDIGVFVEEAVVRRELADNFCYYQPNYDNIDGCYGWAKITLEAHKADKRAYVYTIKQLEEGKTHDVLWNAAQMQVVTRGKMHGFLRMYWAKKILEWTKSPEDALEAAFYLNDHYQLDGCDPNGVVGCMWSICGTHDNAWAERPVFGKIRYMNYEGCRRKFDVDKFVLKYAQKGSMDKFVTKSEKAKSEKAKSSKAK